MMADPASDWLPHLVSATHFLPVAEGVGGGQSECPPVIAVECGGQDRVDGGVRLDFSFRRTGYPERVVDRHGQVP